MNEANITIQCVKGGFVVHYPESVSAAGPVMVAEVATSLGKAMRIAKAAVETFSLVAKSKEDAEA